MLEAEGYKVHVTTSPHLVRYNERIRAGGRADFRRAAGGCCSKRCSMQAKT
jgi:folylpolyglutamate synthase/dihydropteroate synthase